MKEVKRVRVKVKVRKINIRKILLFLVTLLFLFTILYFIVNKKISNIYITNNNILSDKEIISYANLDTYPSYFLSFKFKIKKDLLTNPYISNVSIKKKWFKVYITIEENKLIAIYNNKLLLSNYEKVDNIYNINYLPIIINDIDSIYNDFIYYFSKIDNNILLKISQIEYAKTDVDNDRFLLYMNDGNSVYITLTKIEKINKYSSILAQLDNKKGIIYLDSGDYIELK